MGGNLLFRLGYFRELRSVLILGLAAAAVSGCSDAGFITTFKARDSQNSNSGPAWRWSAPVAIDANPDSGTFYNVNDDRIAACISMLKQPDAPDPVRRGCMQPPAIAYADSRWMVGFSQNYLSAAPSTESRFSLLINMMDAATGLFSSLFGTNLGLIDTGHGIDGGFDADTVADSFSSSRHFRFATLPNGNVIAAFVVEEPSVPLGAESLGVVYANVYDAVLDTWGPAVRLGHLSGGESTHGGSDFGTAKTPFCRPVVTAAPDNTAMVAWCEDDGTTGPGVKYAIYDGGSWSPGNPASPLIDPASTYGFPGMSAQYTEFTADIATGDEYYAEIRVEPGITYKTTVTAVDYASADGEFTVVRDSSGVVMCETLENLVGALLYTEAEQSTADPGVWVSSGTTLAQQGVSMSVHGDCPTTKIISTIYNRALQPLFVDLNDASDHKVTGVTRLSGAGLTTVTDLEASAGNMPQVDWWKTGMLDVAAYGVYDEGSSSYRRAEFVLVRSAVSPVFKTDLTKLESARGLLSHEYSIDRDQDPATSDWKRRSNLTVDAGAPAFNEPETIRVSRVPVCSSSAGDSVACSVELPKIVLSSSGEGLVLFYQNQPGYSGLVGNPNPKRLWYAPYTSTYGYAAPGLVDPDVACTTTTAANDRSVCQVGAYDSENPGDASFCQALDEPGANPLAVTNDPPPIAAAMNVSGKAVVAFHKRVQLKTNECSDYAGVYVKLYDPLLGFYEDKIVSDDLGPAMHAQAAINSRGDVAVVWEQYTDPDKYVYLVTRIDGVWSSPVVMNEGLLDSDDAMMPSVSINDDGEIIVSFTHGEEGRRRQYATRYYYH